MPSGDKLADIWTGARRAIARVCGLPYPPARIQHPSVPTGWPVLDTLIGIGGYPEHRLTHIHGSVQQTFELTRDWGTVVRIATLNELMHLHPKAKGQRLVVDCTALQETETQARYSLVVHRFQGTMPSTVLWLTAGPVEALPKALKFCAYLRLECWDNQVRVVKNMTSPNQGCSVSLPWLGGNDGSKGV